MSEQNANVNINLRVNGNQQVNAGFDQVASAVGTLGRVLGALGIALSAGGIISGLANAAKAALQVADATGKAAQKAGQATEEFSALSYSAKQANVSQQQLVTGSKSLAQAMSEAGRGGDSLREEYLQLADQMAAIPGAADRITFAQQRLGKSGQELIPWLSQGRAAIEAQMKEADAFGVVIGPKFAAEADRFFTNIQRISDMFSGTMFQSLRKILPEVNRLLDLIIGLTKESGVLSLAVDAVVYVFQDLARKVALLEYAFNVLTGTAQAFVESLMDGKTFAQAIEAADQQAEIAKLKFKVRLGEINKMGREAADVTTKAIEAAEGGEPEEQRVARLKKELDLRRDLLDLKIAEQQYVIAKNQFSAEQRGFVSEAELISLRAANAEVERLIDQKRQLTSNARFGDGNTASFLTGDEFQSYETKDRTALLNNQKAGQGNRFSQTNVFDQLRESMVEMQRAAGTIAQQIARTFTTVIGGAVRAISQGITGLINGTKTWGMALREIGSSVMNMVIEEIVRMGVQWVITHVLMEGVAKGFSYLMRALKGEEHAQTMSQESSKTSLLATNAALSTVSSYGGAILTIIALAAAVAGFAGAFAQGGRPPAGRVSLVGEQGPELFIPDQGGTIIPNHSMDRYLADLQKPGAAPTALAKSKDLNLSILFDKREMRRQMQITDNEFMDAFKRNRHRLAI